MRGDQSLRKEAWVLSGGGSKGSWQIGAIEKILMQTHGVLPDAIYGTSVGSINAGSVAYLGVERAKEVWRSIHSRSDVLSSNWYKLPFASGVYSMRPLERLLGKFIRGEPKCTAISCLVSLKSGLVKYVSNREHSLEDYRRGILASASIPFVMEPVKWEGEPCSDGGVREQAPLARAIHDGYRKIRVFLCNPVRENPSDGFEASWPRILSVGWRALDLMEHEIFLNDIHRCLRLNEYADKAKVDLKLYAPLAPLQDTLDFSQDSISKAMDRGFAEATDLLEAGVLPLMGFKNS
jgi:predicted acylesterase/phospholipase RssA